MAAKRTQDHWPDQIEKIYNTCVRNFDADESIEVPSDQLIDVALHALGLYAGGRCLYVDKGTAVRRYVRDFRIYQDSAQLTNIQLAKQFGITTAAIGRILKRERINRRTSF